MEIECILKTWIKEKNKDDKHFLETPIYNRNAYDRKKYKFKEKLQIVSIIKNEDGKYQEVEMLKEIEIDSSTGHIYLIHFHTVSYSYDSKQNIIYCNNTIQNI